MAEPALEAAFERIGSALERHLEVSNAAGAALAVTNRDEILGVVTRGAADAAAARPVQPATRFQIGSISKSFAALVVLQEHLAGRLPLDVSVNALLPWLELPEPFGPITLHHLLTHTSGLAIGTEEAPNGPGAIWIARTVPPTSAPGARFWYSNDGYKLVGLVLERVCGMPIHELLRERVLQPLGMHASTAAIDDGVRGDLAVGYEPMFQDRPAQLTHPLVPANWSVSNTADGSIVSDVLDMSAYARLLLAGGDAPGGPLLPEEGFELWTAPHVADPDEPGWSYGYGWSVGEREGRRRIQHSGGMVGFTALLVTEPDEGLGCVILQNGGGAKAGVVDAALDEVRAALAAEDPPQAWAPRAPDAVPNAADYVGVYTDGRRTFEVTAEGAYRVRLGVGDITVLLQQDPLSPPTDTFLVPHPALERFPLTFGRDGAGVVVEVLHGDAWLRGDRWTGGDPEPAPPAWSAYPGLYRSQNPWAPVLRVALRKGRLAALWPAAVEDQGKGELIPLDDGWFAIGAVEDPQRIRFLGEIEGKAVVAEVNGGRWYRSFER